MKVVLIVLITTHSLSWFGNPKLKSHTQQYIHFENKEACEKVKSMTYRIYNNNGHYGERTPVLSLECVEFD